MFCLCLKANQYKAVGMRKFIFFTPVIFLLLLTGCGKYNYSNIFGVDKSVINKGKYQKGGDVLLLHMSHDEFNKLKGDAKKTGFIDWYPVDVYSGITSGKFRLKGTPGGDNLIYSVKNTVIDGCKPVIAYDEKTQTVYFIISDGIGG